MAEDRNHFVLNLSVVYRNIQKYFDKVLAPYDIGSGQWNFLFVIYENEGVTMQEVSRICEVDKGTTTKSIQKLIDREYVVIKNDEQDRRVKRLYATRKVTEIMPALYEARNQLFTLLGSGVDLDRFEKDLERVSEASRSELPSENRYEGILIGGLQKTTLLDYPGKAAATIFTSGCNFKCPYCHNKDLVFIPENYEFFDPAQVIHYLEKRRGLLDGVCISGGEPLIQEGLPAFLEAIKALGYLIKIDTNGSYPVKLKELIDRGLADYVALDVKNVPERYAETVGAGPEGIRFESIRETIAILLADTVDYEIRTTVIREFHTEEDIIRIAEMIRGTKRYFLQKYEETDRVIQPGWHSYTNEEMNHLADLVRPVIPNVSLRGLKEE